MAMKHEKEKLAKDIKAVQSRLSRLANTCREYSAGPAGFNNDISKAGTLLSTAATLAYEASQLADRFKQTRG